MNRYKKIVAIVIAVMIAVLVISGCGKQEEEPKEIATPTPEATKAAEPTPTPEPVSEGIVWAQLPEDGTKTYPLPEGYRAVTNEEDAVIGALPYDVYRIDCANGDFHDTAFGQEVSATGQIVAQGWYTFVVNGGIMLSDTTKETLAAYPVPEGYTAVDAKTDHLVPARLGFSLYRKANEDGSIGYMAFGSTGIKDTEEYTQGWSVVLVRDEMVTAETAKTLLPGERIVALAKADSEDGSVKTGDVVDSFIIGDPAKTYDTSIFETYNVIRKVLDIETVAEPAVPVEGAQESAAVDGAQNNGTQGSGAASNGSSASTGGKPSGGSSGGANNTGGSGSSGSSGGSAADPNAGKTYHEAVYEKVWVVDVPASSHEEPVYGKEARDICNVCGADVTGDATAHAKAHAMAGEGGGHHTEWITVQTGTKTVNVPEQGHWEQRLVREAGWY